MNVSLSQFQPLNAHQIKSVLDPVCLQRLEKLDVFDSIDSTNTYLLQQSRAFQGLGWACFAEEQTSGRGRRGRTWLSPKGTNIYFSLLWQFSQQDVSSLSIAVAAMIITALKKYGVTQDIKLKWPNDVLFSGRKLAGILLERSGSSVVVGIGLNTILPAETADMLEGHSIGLVEITDAPVDRNYLAGLLLNELLNGLFVYAQQGLSPFLNTWKNHDALLNQSIMVHTPEKIFTGVMQGINEEGELLLLNESHQLQCFRYGEVTVRMSSPSRDR